MHDLKLQQRILRLVRLEATSPAELGCLLMELAERIETLENEVVRLNGEGSAWRAHQV